MYDNNDGCGCGGLCTVPVAMSFMFLIMRIVDIVKWEWYWIISPIWISAGLVIVAFLIMLTISVIMEVVSD